MVFTRGVSLIFLLAFNAVISTVINRSADCKNEDGKCTANDPREHLYPICMYEEKKSTLWCNYSNYTRIPDPDDVEKDIYQPCKSATTLDISDSCLRKLKRSDLAKYPNMMTLKCRQNLISTIRVGLFEENTKLERLDFCTNSIKTIEAGSFKGLKNLNILILDNNDLDKLDGRMFEGLSSLQKLSIHRNDIAVLKRKTFVAMRHLKVLVLTGNKIAYIEEEAFVGLDSLTTLQLDGNRLSGLSKDTPARLPNLRILSLSYNEFVSWPEFDENVLANLETLNLGHNMLDEIKSSNIANLSKLQNLSLENNSLSYLPDDLHLHIPNLRYLNISKNHFETLGQYAFSKLCFLETLDIRGNRLTTPYAEWFSRVTENGVPILNVTNGNQWKCDCSVIQYEDFLGKLNGVEWQKALLLTCHSPKRIVLAVSEVLNFHVVEAIRERYDCGTKEPFVKSERQCNFTYPYPKTDPTTYQPTTKQETTTEAKTIAADSTTHRQVTDGDMKPQNLQTPKIEHAGPDKLAITFIAVALVLLLVIIACSAFYVRRRRQEKSDKLDSEESINQDNRADGVEEKLLSPASQDGILQGSAQGDDGPKSTSETIKDETYITMEPFPRQNTIPKEVGSGCRTREQYLMPPPPGVRRQPEGSSFKSNET